MLTNNLTAIQKRFRSDYIPIGLFSSYEQASDFKKSHEVINPFRQEVGEKEGLQVVSRNNFES